MEPLPDLLIEPIVRAALAEDLGRAGDVTSTALLPRGQRLTATVAPRSRAALSGRWLPSGLGRAPTWASRLRASWRASGMMRAPSEDSRGPATGSDVTTITRATSGQATTAETVSEASASASS